ncbi:MAG TPA: S41 family peptidase [Edaphobacter sp.]
MPKITKILLLVVSVVLVLTVFLGVNSSGVNAATDGQDGAYRQINVYSEVLRHIQTDYVEEPNIPTVTNGALRGLLESLDSDSSYLTPDDYKAFKEDKGGKAQVGINVSKRWGYATVVSVVPGSPADKANLNDGDIIEAIGTQDTRDLSLAVIRLMLEGTPGSELSLSVVRPRKAAPEKLTMTRVVTPLPPVGETMYENSSILYLKPGVLDHEHVQQVESKLKGMSKAGNKKILLDLRDVADGENAEAIRMANFLLKSGTIVTLEGQKVEKQTFAAEGSKSINTSSPVVVLVNRGTAGPAEIVAAALMDNKRADVVGEKTFGEGSQQKTFELPDGAALILSVAKYESPAGKKLEDEGVTPGVLVASNIDDNSPVDEDATPDSQQQQQPQQTKKPSVSVDEQLNKALDLLKSKAA